jgi:predicted ATP-grasp superfamily ATP-dependent carboligase
MEQTVKNKVIVFGRDNYNTLGLARQLGNENLDLLFLMPDGINHCATKSKYCHNIKHVKDHSEAVEYLLSNNLDEQVKPIIVAGADLEAEALDQNRDALIKHYILPGTMEQGLLTRIDDKNTMVKIAEEIGFTVPKSLMITAESPIPDSLVFPCLIKPAKYPSGYKKEFKMKKCDNRIQLENTLRHVRKDSVFILQEYIPKDVEIFINGCRTWDKEITIAGTCYRDRYYNDISHGRFTKGISELIDMNLVKSMLERIDFYGLFSFEFGRYNGKAYFFETNLRNDGAAYSFFKAGANLPLVWVYSSAGLDYTLVPSHVRNEIWYMDELYDCLNIKKGVVSREQWQKERDEAGVFRYYDEDDLGPWKYVYRRRHLLRAKRILVEKYRPQLVKLLDIFH